MLLMWSCAPLGIPTAWLPLEPQPFPESERRGGTSSSVLGTLAHERAFLEDLSKLPPSPPWGQSHFVNKTSQQPCVTVFFRHIRKCAARRQTALLRK